LYLLHEYSGSFCFGCFENNWTTIPNHKLGCSKEVDADRNKGRDHICEKFPNCVKLVLNWALTSRFLPVYEVDWLVCWFNWKSTGNRRQKKKELFFFFSFLFNVSLFYLTLLLFVCLFVYCYFVIMNTSSMDSENNIGPFCWNIIIVVC
jgi:hypothetical protein